MAIRIWEHWISRKNTSPQVCCRWLKMWVERPRKQRNRKDSQACSHSCLSSSRMVQHASIFPHSQILYHHIPHNSSPTSSFMHMIETMSLSTLRISTAKTSSQWRHPTQGVTSPVWWWATRLIKKSRRDSKRFLRIEKSSKTRSSRLSAESLTSLSGSGTYQRKLKHFIKILNSYQPKLKRHKMNKPKRSRRRTTRRQTVWICESSRRRNL